MIYLSSQQIIDIHKRLIADSGGEPGIRSIELLESALAAPFQTFDGEDLYLTIYEKAARLAFGLVMNHAFLDGNKRIAAAAMLVFLHLNEIMIETTQRELSNLFIQTANKQKGYEDILNWIITHTDF
ncbi:MAG: type II toxin-antitoxin system death-on-curing family toxin [Flexilinea sp.]|nr:type II toxin-antitoxin system death-on-curing family toxin [Flexilinea sp.]